MGGHVLGSFYVLVKGSGRLARSRNNIAGAVMGAASIPPVLHQMIDGNFLVLDD